MFNAVNLQFDHLIINWIIIEILVSAGWVHDWKVCKYVSVDFNLNAKNDKKYIYIYIFHNSHYDVLVIVLQSSKPCFDNIIS